jgi:phage tail P2-like protein
MTISILPPNATASERGIEAATERAFDLPVPNGQLWDAATCPAALLPWLAFALSVDEWDAGWTVETKRRVIAASVAIHRRKGTIGAVKAAIATAGYGDATLIENYGVKLYDGTLTHDGASDHAAVDHWAEYRLILTRPLSIAQAQVVRRIAAAVAPARCHLKAIDYRQALNLYDGTITHDGAYSHGVA